MSKPTKTIYRARAVVTMDGPLLANGAVVVETDRIVDVGVFDEIRARTSGAVVDLGERVLMPGLINAHCHLDYTCLRGKIPPRKSFTDWIRSINAEKAKLTPDDYINSINEGFAEALRFGTTTILNLIGSPELMAHVHPTIRCLWFPELINVRSADKAPANLTGLTGQVADGPEAGTGEPRCVGLAPHALYTASAELFRECQQRASRVTTHLAESREEREMFRDRRGELYDFLKSIGRDMSDCGGKTPLQEFVGRVGEASLPRWIVAHLNELTEEDSGTLERLASKFHVVHCPRSHAYFGHSRFQFERLRELGFNVCLGTDSLASNGDLSLFAEMRAFAQNYAAVLARDIVAMTTINPARALGLNAGKIVPGAIADLIAIPQVDRDIYENISNFDGQPALIARGA